MPSGPRAHLWPVKAYTSAPSAGASTGMLPTDWAPSIRVVTPRSRARAQISSRGKTSPPVHGGEAEVHPVGRVLGKGDILRVGVDETGRGLAGARCDGGLAGVETDALEVGLARAEVVGRAHGLDHGVGVRAAPAGVQVHVVVRGEGREGLAREARVAADGGLLRGSSGSIPV